MYSILKANLVFSYPLKGASKCFEFASKSQKNHWFLGFRPRLRCPPDPRMCPHLQNPKYASDNASCTHEKLIVSVVLCVRDHWIPSACRKQVIRQSPGLRSMWSCRGRTNHADPWLNVFVVLLIIHILFRHYLSACCFLYVCISA